MRRALCIGLILCGAACDAERQVRSSADGGAQGGAELGDGVDASEPSPPDASLDPAFVVKLIATGAFFPSVSGDGQLISVTSAVDSLVPGDTNAVEDAFVYDQQTKTFERVSVDSSGAQGNGASRVPQLSSNGRFVAFESAATNLVPGDTNGKVDVFLRDRQLGTTTRVSVDSNGLQANDDSGGCSRKVAVANDGTVAFCTLASNLVADDTNGLTDIFVRDAHSLTTTRVSVSSSGAQGDDHSAHPSISDDGRYVVFDSGATAFVAGKANLEVNVFLHDRQTGETTVMSVDSNGTLGDSVSPGGKISADGRIVAMWSMASNLVADDTNGKSDIFIRDRILGKTSRVSVATSGAEADDNMEAIVDLSADGRYVAFATRAASLIANDVNGAVDVYVHDRATSRTNLVSISENGDHGNADSLWPGLSADGHCLVFFSFASNLVSPAVAGTGSTFSTCASDLTIIW